MVKFIYSTDIHGTRSIYEKIFSLGKSRDIDFIVFGGDITSGVNPRGQNFFLRFYLIPRCWIFRKRHKKPIFIMMGNDDFSSNSKLLKKAGNKRKFCLIHNRYYKLREVNVAGYPFINPTPFLLKDWEKTEQQISEDLEKLSKDIEMEKTIYIFHAPPYGTNLDIISNGEHKGSKAIYDFIKEKQPLMTLHGHIHESPNVSGKIKQKIGNTLCINPGGGRIVEIDTEKMTVKKIDE